ncbi:serine carboxypeptidase-like 16 [Chenopodium quinoa]|uniref:serine carboxypeptidase-like 16 n=1 Tax=Chenopodium quinoa TaxID=63459 RepID=UPI000B778A49|nr:serine carboxypeptidase-like 16 [Chenopodium quinoa]
MSGAGGKGPLSFNTSACNWHSKAPIFQLNPSSWTKIANIIFLDSPVGTGFSHATNPEGYYSDDITSSRHIYQFLRKWLKDHDGFQNNPLFISGDSYSGKIVPIVVQEISNGNLHQSWHDFHMLFLFCKICLIIEVTTSLHINVGK